MPTSRFERFFPVAGVLAGLLFAVNAVLTAGVPRGTSHGAGLQRWYATHQTAGMLAGFAAAYCCVALLLFITGLRQALRSGEPGESTYSTAAFAGGLVVAVSLALSALLTLAATEAAHSRNASTVATIGFLDDFSWVPWAAGSGVLFLAAGLGGVRTATLPRWLAIATVVLGIGSLAGPTGIAVYFVTPVWLVVAGVVLWRALRRSSPAPAREPAARYAPTPAHG